MNDWALLTLCNIFNKLDKINAEKYRSRLLQSGVRKKRIAFPPNIKGILKIPWKYMPYIRKGNLAKKTDIWWGNLNNMADIFCMCFDIMISSLFIHPTIHTLLNVFSHIPCIN